jgi:hypothetical protein
MLCEMHHPRSPELPRDCAGVDDSYRGSTARSIWVLFHVFFWLPVIGIPCILLSVLIPFIGAFAVLLAAHEFSRSYQWTCPQISDRLHKTGFTSTQQLVWRTACVYFRIVLWATGITYTVVGLENLDPRGNYFFACNHEASIVSPASTQSPSRRSAHAGDASRAPESQAAANRCPKCV